jgi:hygromycin-B 7''-O-kinase
MSRIPGRAARHVSVTGPARTIQLHTVGRLLRRLHAQPVDRLAGSSVFRTDVGTDVDAGALRHRLELALADLDDEITSRPGCWQLALGAEEVVVRALEALPPQLNTPVPLHSNPGPTHAFVDADGVLTGLIDFGDSSLNDPALDLRTWSAVSDRLALREGYLEGEAPQGDFEVVWTVAMIYTDLLALLPVAGAAKLRASAMPWPCLPTTPHAHNAEQLNRKRHHRRRCHSTGAEDRKAAAGGHAALDDDPVVAAAG